MSQRIPQKEHSYYSPVKAFHQRYGRTRVVIENIVKFSQIDHTDSALAIHHLSDEASSTIARLKSLDRNVSKMSHNLISVSKCKMPIGMRQEHGTKRLYKEKRRVEK